MYATIVEMIGKFESHWSHELDLSGRQPGDWRYFLCLNEDELKLDHEHEYEDQVFL